MNYEIIDCIDSGTEFCPCKLAEANECILCSQMCGKKFCDCMNWKGTCIYQEFYNNGNKAKEGRKTFDCSIKEVTKLQEDLIKIRFSVSHKLALDLTPPGSYVFLRTDDNVYFDVPISIAYSDTDADEITVLIEIRGIKTKKLTELKVGDILGVRGPYWNGVFGLKNIQNAKNGNCVVIARGIGMAPMLPVIKRLINNGNSLRLIIDKSPYEEIYVKEYLDEYNLTYEEIPVLNNKGELSEEIKAVIKEEYDGKEISLIHCAGADILTYRMIEFTNSLDTNLKISCCNNAKMCCGEGICGSCTARFKGRKVKRLCKVQTDPRNIFEGRRFI